MIHVSRRVALLVALAWAPLAGVRAEGVLDHLPPNAMGFAVVRNLSATNDKLVRLIKIFEGVSEVTPPAPLTLIQAATGLGDGVNEGGDVLLALLPGGDNAAPRPLLLLPVSDYAALAASLSGDGSGAVARVTIAGEDVLVAKKGDYALVMNVEHRPTMETLLAASPQAPPQLEPLADWLAANDVAVVLLPAGLDMLLELGKSSNAAQAAEMEQQFADPAFAEMLGQFKAFTKMSDTFLEFCEREFAAGAVGLAIDDATNLQLESRLILKSDGTFADAIVPKLNASPLAAYPSKPFVIAGGGPLAAGWSERLVKLIRTVYEQFPKLEGFQNFNETDWQELEESWRLPLQVNSASFCVMAGEADDPLFSNIFLVADVDDPTEYVQSLRTSWDLWNGLVKKSASDIKMTYEFADVQVAGKPTLQLTTDVLAAAGDDNVPMVQPLMKSLVGEDGKLRIFCSTVGAKTAIWTVGAEDVAAEAVEFVVGNGESLEQTPEVQVAAGLLDASAQWTAFVSPAGYATWCERAMTSMLPNLGGPVVQIPDFPAGPPVGFSVKVADGRLDAEAVVPVKALEDLAAFIKKYEDL